MTIVPVAFMRLSELMYGLDNVRKEIDRIDISFGDADHTLVTRKHFVNTAKTLATTLDSNALVSEVGILVSRAQNIPDGVMIDLET